MSHRPFTQKQQSVLEALATYRFLTIKQLVALGISSSENSLRANIINPIVNRHKNPVDRYDLGCWQQIPHVFCLNERGTQILSDLWNIPASEIPYPKGGAQFTSQYYHRIAQVDFHIAIRLWAEQIGAEILFVDVDFEKEGSQRHGNSKAKTQVSFADGSYIEPDLIIGFLVQGQVFIYAVEVNCVTDTTRLVRKLERYITVLHENAIAQKYGYDISCYILTVFDEVVKKRKNFDHLSEAKKRSERKMINVQNRLIHMPKFRGFSPAYLFNTMHNIRNDITQGWKTADNQSVMPF